MGRKLEVQNSTGEEGLVPLPGPVGKVREAGEDHQQRRGSGGYRVQFPIRKTKEQQSIEGLPDNPGLRLNTLIGHCPDPGSPTSSRWMVRCRSCSRTSDEITSMRIAS